MRPHGKASVTNLVWLPHNASAEQVSMQVKPWGEAAVGLFDRHRLFRH